MARELAIEVLRYAASDATPWRRAVAVLEGGALRMRHAVELAGLVIDAVGVTGEEMIGRKGVPGAVPEARPPFAFGPLPCVRTILETHRHSIVKRYRRSTYSCVCSSNTDTQ